MKRILTYWIFLFAVLASCEDPYYPDIDKIENVIVADARLVMGSDSNYIFLYKTVGFYERKLDSEQISGAQISISDANGNSEQVKEEEPGRYKVDLNLNPDAAYQLTINYGGHSYESTFEAVPKVPELDTVFGIAETKVMESGDGNDADDYRTVDGLQLYTDITSNLEMPYYRFTARIIMQYIYLVEVMRGGALDQIPMYAWASSYPKGAFNIASPAEYSTVKGIYKHPLYFTSKDPNPGFKRRFAGWIIELTQHGLTENGHNYYDDLNKQLDADGRLFDPLYVQARSNLKCTSDPSQIILGNFEISASNTTQYFVKFQSDETGYVLRKLEENFDIPLYGEQLEILPEFWQWP